MDLTAGNQSPICTATSSAVVPWAGRRDSRIYSVQGRTGVSPVPLGPVRAGKFEDPSRSLFSDVRQHRSIQRNQLPCWTGGTPALLYGCHAFAACQSIHVPCYLLVKRVLAWILENPALQDRESIGRVGHKSSLKV